ncbi:MAG: integrase core domain-containing protein [Deferribacterales bacterium]
MKRDTIDNHFEILKGIVKRYGRFVALYYDNDEKYSYIRHGNSRFFEYKKEKADLQVVRALSEIGTTVINSRPFDPRGKGKIERFIRTVTLQLPVWFRHYEVKTLEEANQVLKRYIRYYNSEQIHREIRTTPQKKFFSLKEESKFTKVGSEIDLDKVFSYRYERKVGRDNTIRFNGAVYQLEREPFVYSYTGKNAEIRYFPNKHLSIYIDGESVRHKKLLTLTKKVVKSKGNSYGKVAI